MLRSSSSSHQHTADIPTYRYTEIPSSFINTTQASTDIPPSYVDTPLSPNFHQHPSAMSIDVGRQLFVGKRFWVGMRVPCRNTYIQKIRDNGGTIEPLEKNADYLIADHLRRDAPTGALSYTFIDKSLDNNRPEDPEDHLCGPAAGSVRDVSSTRPAKTSRAQFTALDDRVCYKWGMQAQESGVSHKGNEIWKTLETLNKRHTWQSWRTRWLKSLDGKPAPAGWEDAPVVFLNNTEEAASVDQDSKTLELRSSIPKGPSKNEMQTGAVEVVVHFPSSKNTNGPIETQVDGSSERPLRQPSAPTAPSSAEIKEELYSGPNSPSVHSQPTTIASTDYQSNAKSPFGETWPDASAVQGIFQQSGASPLRKGKQREITPRITSNLMKSVSNDSGQLARDIFTAEDFLELYPHIKEIMEIDETDLPLAWTQIAASDHKQRSAQGWGNFFRAEIWPVHRRVMDYDEEAANAKAELVTEQLVNYIALYPHAPFPGWKGILKALAGPASRKRSQDRESAQGSIQIESVMSRKRLRISEEVQNANTAYEGPSGDVTESIETHGGLMDPKQIDLTGLEDTSSSSNSDSESPSQSFPRGSPSPKELLSEEDTWQETADEEQFATAPPETQAILNSETQDVDLAIPEPEDGWANPSQEADGEGTDETDEQDLINKQLQFEASQNESLDLNLEPDDETLLGLPEPEGGFEKEFTGDVSQNSNGAEVGNVDIPPVTTAEDDMEDESETENFEVFAESLIQKGFSPRHIIEAVHATSGNKSLIEVVLHFFKMGKGVPKEVRGVWTREDDIALRGSDTKAIRQVEAKHGVSGLEGWRERIRFLREEGEREVGF